MHKLCDLFVIALKWIDHTSFLINLSCREKPYSMTYKQRMTSIEYGVILMLDLEREQMLWSGKLLEVEWEVPMFLREEASNNVVYIHNKSSNAILEENNLEDLWLSYLHSCTKFQLPKVWTLDITSNSKENTTEGKFLWNRTWKSKIHTRVLCSALESPTRPTMKMDCRNGFDTYKMYIWLTICKRFYELKSYVYDLWLSIKIDLSIR